MEISITKSKRDIVSCNSCLAQNYESSTLLNKKVDTIWELRVGNTVVSLCSDCLAEIHKLIEQEIRD